MSRELMESLARQADAGGALFDDRASAVVEPARARVRRTRRLRAAGAAGAAALVVAAGVVGATMLAGGESPLAPAGTRGDALMAEDVLALSRAAVGPESTGPGQEIAHCVVDPRDNPWSAQAQAAFMTLAMDCGRAFAGDAPLVEMTTTSLASDGSGVMVEWEVRNASDQPLRLDPAGSAVAVMGMSEDVELTPWVSGNIYVGPPVRHPDNTLGVVLRSGSAPLTLAPGDTLSGAEYIAAGQQVEGVPDAVAMIIAGELTPTVAVQLRVAPAGEPSTSEVFLHVESDAVEVIHRGTLARTAEEFLAASEPRVRDGVRGGTQAALDCAVPLGGNPRMPGTEGDQAWVECDARWLLTESPLVTLTEFTTSYDASTGQLTVTWTAQNTAGEPLRLDTGGAMVTVETHPTSAPPDNEIAESSTLGTVTTQTLWLDEEHRSGVMRRASAVETVGPWQLFAGEAIFDWDVTERAVDPRFGLQVRIAREDDAAEVPGASELLLEVPWEE